jgi:hypothetical protein
MPIYWKCTIIFRMCPLYTWTLSPDACTISLSTIIFTQFLVSHALRFLLAECRISCFLLLLLPGELARKLYELLKRDAAAVKIQRDLRRFLARKSYIIRVQSFWRGESIKCPFIGNLPLFSYCVLYTPGHYQLMHVPFH